MEIALKRILKNDKMFSEEELDIVKSNLALISKVYLLGLIDSKN